MARMRAIGAGVMEREGVARAFGVPAAAINPLYSAPCRAVETMSSHKFAREAE